jgi:hypothetical protein
MSDLEFYELHIRKLGIDFYEFQERLAIFLENRENFIDSNDNAKIVIFTQFKNEQLAKLGMKKINVN